MSSSSDLVKRAIAASPDTVSLQAWFARYNRVKADFMCGMSSRRDALKELDALSFDPDQKVRLIELLEWQRERDEPLQGLVKRPDPLVILSFED